MLRSTKLLNEWNRCRTINHFFSRFLSSPITPIESEYATEIQDTLQDYQYRKERKQSLVGTIVSTKTNKTIVVEVPREKYISKYGKMLIRQKRFMAHDELETAMLGDLVRIVPCPPKSARKRHQIIDIIKRTPNSLELIKNGLTTRMRKSGASVHFSKKKK